MKKIFLLALLILSACRDHKEPASFIDIKQTHNYKDVYPVQRALVNDYEGLFSQKQEGKLESLLSEFDSSSQNKILLLTVKAYDEDFSFQDYISRVAKRWHIDQNNDGRTLLIVLSKEKRKISFSFGNGVKNLTEFQANEIVSNKVLPQFRSDNYYAGIQTCIVEITRIWK